MLRWLTLTFALLATPAAAAEWVLSMVEPRVKAGARFEFDLHGPAGEALPGRREIPTGRSRAAGARASCPPRGA